MNESPIETRRAEDSTRRDEWRTLGLCFVAALMVFLLTLSQNHGEAEDSLGYARALVRGSAEEVFHPNHLLVLPLAKALGWLLGFVGFSLAPITILQLCNSLAGAVTLTLIARSGMKSGWSPSLSLLVAALAGTTYGYWYYAVEGETYVLPLPFLWLAFESAWARPSFSDTRRFFWIALWGSLATLLHQQHALSCLVIVGWSTFQLIREGRPWVRPVAVCAATGLGLIGFSYVIIGVFAVGASSFEELLAWSKGHAKNGMWTPFSVLSPIKALAGMGKAVLGLHYLFSFEFFEKAMTRAFPGKILIEEKYLAEKIPGLFRVLALAATLASGIAAALLTYVLVRADRRSGASNSSGSGAISSSLLLSAFVVYAIFNTLWEPQNVEFWIAPTMFLAVIVGNLVFRTQGRSVVIAQALVGAFFIANFFGSIWPQAQKDADYWYVAIAPSLEVLEGDDILITECGYICNRYLNYYGESQVIQLSKIEPEALERELSTARGRILVTSWAYSPPNAIEESGQLKDWERERSFEVLSRYRRASLVQPEKGPELFLLERP